MIKPDTKQIFADAFFDLLEKKSFDSISISDIVNACGASRQTFYNHFQDKDAFVLWIARQGQPQKEFDLSHLTSLSDSMLNYLKHVQSHRTFFRKAFQSESQNSLMTTVIQDFQKALSSFVMQSQGKPLSAEQAFNIRVLSYGYAYAQRDWVLHGCRLPAKAFVTYFTNMYPPSLCPYLLDENIVSDTKETLI